MGNVHFSGRNREIPSHVLNTRQNSPLEQNNVRFRIKGAYLTDFSDKGIKDFIQKHQNRKSGFLGSIGLGWGGKDLEFKEVKAFIQAAAANAESLQGKTFDLTDPELGLFDDDDVTVKDIKHSFDLKYSSNAGRSDASVDFVDTQEVRYHHREARNAEKTAHTAYERAQNTDTYLQSELDKAIRERDKIADRVGGDAVARLAEVDSRIGSIDQKLGEIDSDMSQARRRLSQRDVPEPEKRELRLMLRGMESEKTELQNERKDLQKSLTKKHGFWSFLGGGSNLEDLRRANAAVERARERKEAHAEKLETARNNWQQAVQQREAIERGESMAGQGSAPTDAAEPDADTPAAAAADRPAAPDADPAPTAADDAPEVEVPTGQASRPAAAAADRPAAPAVDPQPASDPVTPAPAAQPAVPAQPATPAASAQPVALTAQNFASMDPEARADRFLALPDAQQDLLFSSLSFEDQQDLLLRLGQKASAPAILGRLSALMSERNRQALADNLRETQEAAQGQPFPFNTSMNLILHELSKQGITPNQAPAAAAEPTPAAPPARPTAPVQPAAPAQSAAPARPPVTIEDEGPASPVAPAQPAAPVAPTAPAQPAPAPARPAVVEEAAPVSPATVAEAPAAPVAAPAIPAESNREALAILQSLVQADPQTGERFQAFYALPDTSKQAIMTELEVQKQVDPANKAVAVQLQAEFFSGLAYLYPEDGVRGRLMAALPAEARSDLKANLEATLPEIQAFEGLSAADKQELINAQQLLIRELSASPSQTAPRPVQGPPAPPAAAGPDPVQLARELTSAPKADRQARFAALPLEHKQQVFSAMSREVKGEMLGALVQPHPNAADRQALVASLSAQEKSRLSAMLQESLPVLRALGETQAVANTEQVLRDLGAAVPTGVAPAAAGPAPAAVEDPAAPQGPVQPTSEPLPIANLPAANAPQPGRLDMTPQVNQLRAVVTERSMFGYGGVTQPQAMHQLVEEIWSKGTLQNKQDMAKLLVDNKEAQTLANLLANVTVDEAEAVAVMTVPNFPGSRFMNDIDDSRAFIMLNYLSTAAAEGGDSARGARQLISDTTKAYTGTLWDREAPFERMRNTARANGNWDKLPADLRTAIDKLLR
ncbi:MAG: hypothetical protein IGS03_03000 [Candidatus Sericytochromatia bacterium]|nr:hypothetical protein [Candidatus Sericytochromatia bacterium]